MEVPQIIQVLLAEIDIKVVDLLFTFLFLGWFWLQRQLPPNHNRLTSQIISAIPKAKKRPVTGRLALCEMTITSMFVRLTRHTAFCCVKTQCYFFTRHRSLRNTYYCLFLFLVVVVRPFLRPGPSVKNTDWAFSRPVDKRASSRETEKP